MECKVLDLSAVISVVFLNIWPFLIIIVIITFFKSPWIKGKIGEAIVNTSNKLLLDKDDYIPVKDVTLQLSDGSTTQIDHILVSRYGVFVIETKNMKGWIFGGEHQKQWTQQIFKEKNRFQNPLHQNYRHLKALEETLGLSTSSFTSIVAFVGETEFKTPMPENVFNGLSYTKYIKSFRDERLTPSEIRQTLGRLKNNRLQQGFATDREHVQNLKRRMQPAFNIPNDKTCSRCGSEMVKRTNRKNGQEFYGCSSYPRCKNTITLDSKSS